MKSIIGRIETRDGDTVLSFVSTKCDVPDGTPLDVEKGLGRDVAKSLQLQLEEQQKQP